MRSSALAADGSEIVAPDGTAGEPSSLGLVAEGASGLLISRTTIYAGRGANGIDGVVRSARPSADSGAALEG